MPDTFRVHYHRPHSDYGGWTLYAWGDTTENTEDYFGGPVKPTGQDVFGAFFDVGLITTAQHVSIIIHNPTAPGGDKKDPGPDMHCNVGSCSEVWVLSGDSTVYVVNPLTAAFVKLQAFWIDRETVTIPHHKFNSAWTYSLLYSHDAALSASNLTANAIALAPDHGLTEAQLKRFPQLAHCSVLKLTSSAMSEVPLALKSQLAVIGRDSAGQLNYITGVQTTGVLDDLFFYTGPLGPEYGANAITLRLWAPTAQSVDLLLFKKSDAKTAFQEVAMTEANGLWSVSIDPAPKGLWYVYRVQTYVPIAQKILQNLVTDPYSYDLSLNGLKSRLTNLNDSETKPPGWDQHAAPHLASLNDLTIYELHVRDFSATDESVPADERGTYLAFTHPQANGMRHLHDLAEAGLKVIHLLPTFHIASVNENKSVWQTTGDLSTFPADSAEQQDAVAAIQGTDAYNWGYDPVHYMAPSGAYAVNPDNRVREYRQMVQALHTAGLRIVQDCVFNHTSAGGELATSVLDKIVPNYYYRLDPDGNIYNSTCCPNTASEHLMMEKLILDTLLTNARQYKIDGFRFDLMNFHFVSNMRHFHDALSKLTVQNDGVDGSKIYLYGEGWNFGETVNDHLGVAATQANLYGTGVGSFNDRVRDAIRGGNPFTDQRIPGFTTGLDVSEGLLGRTDWIKIAVAGNLRNFLFTDHNGKEVKGGQVDYLGQGAGYTASPSECINFCSVHDNQALFDAIQLKSPVEDDTATRARRQILSISIIALGQGIPFFQAADDLLRSKSMDQNSYNSGDWFNRIDWSYQSNGWGSGLPIARENKKNWAVQRPLLANTALKPSPADIEFARKAFQEFLRIRQGSRLFRMQTVAEIQKNLLFFNNGPDQKPGLIVMQLKANGGNYGPFSTIVVGFNANRGAIVYQNPKLEGLNLRLHPVQSGSSDPLVRQAAADDAGGTLHIPGLTAAVFVVGG